MPVAGPTRHAWACVALRSGGLPTADALNAWFAARGCGVQATDAVRLAEDAAAERTLLFAQGVGRVGAAHFPRPVVGGEERRVFVSHSSHVFLSVAVPDDHKAGRRLLGRAAAAVTQNADAAFVWWGRNGGIYRPEPFLKRVFG